MAFNLFDPSSWGDPASNLVRGLGHAAASAGRGDLGGVGEGFKRAGGGVLNGATAGMVGSDSEGNLSWEGIGSDGTYSPGNAMSGLTDAVGITDTKAGDRANDAIQSGIDQANQTMTQGLAPVYENINSARDTRRYNEQGNLIGGRDRSWGNLLDQYDSFADTTNALSNRMMNKNQEQAQNAMSDENVQSFMNPYSEQAMNQAAQAAAGRAGSALQSSAANRDIANAVSDKYGEMYNQAMQNANQDFANKYNANKFSMAGLQQNLNTKNNQMTWDMQPTETYNDLAGTETSQRYESDIAKAQANAENAGRSRSWLQNILGG